MNASSAGTRNALDIELPGATASMESLLLGSLTYHLDHAVILMGSGLFAESSVDFRSTFHADGQILEQARQQIRSIYGPLNLTAVGAR